MRCELIVPLKIQRRFLPPFQGAPGSFQRNYLAEIQNLVHRIKQCSATSIDCLKQGILEFVEMGAVQKFRCRQDTVKRTSKLVTKSQSQSRFNNRDATKKSTYDILPIKSPFCRSAIRDSTRLYSAITDEPNPRTELSSTEDENT